MDKGITASLYVQRAPDSTNLPSWSANSIDLGCFYRVILPFAALRRVGDWTLEFPPLLSQNTVSAIKKQHRDHLRHHLRIKELVCVCLHILEPHTASISIILV
jgi:hypothetical protein